MQVRQIPISEIAPSPLNPRKTFDADELLELANSIKENGLIQPITLRKLPKNAETKYEIVCGERRYRACVLNGMETIEAVVKTVDDKHAFLCMVLENLQRKDVDPIEEGAALQHLYKEVGCKVREIAKAIGKSESYVVSRIQLNKVSAEFVSLYRSKVLQLIHLLEICKLTAEQQGDLFTACFSPEHIEQWKKRILPMEDLAAMIDTHVMNSLDKARFNPADSTYKTCGACHGCKFNTATHPKRFNDTDRPRCMKRSLYQWKNVEAVAREAKKSGMGGVYIGTEEANRGIVKAIEAYGLTVSPIGNREYVLMPTEPDAEKIADKEYYAKRKSAYDVKRAAFDESIADGSIVPVMEVAINGQLTGEVKYLYNTPADEKGNVSADSEARARCIENMKRSLYESKGKEIGELTERRREMLGGNHLYSVDGSPLNGRENGIFLALILKRLSAPFRECIGIDFMKSLDMEQLTEAAVSHQSEIMREFMRVTLSEESVNYSDELATLLGMLTMERMVDEDSALSEEVHAKHEKERDFIRTRMEKMKNEMPEADNPD